jgi:hypothetical protein
MNKKYVKSWIFIIILTVFLTACSGFSSTRMGWVCINPDNGLDCSYSLFTGQEMDTVKLDEGEFITLSYEVKVESGAIQILVLDPSDQTIWQVDLTQNISDEIKIQASESGIFRIVVNGDETEGSFRLTWE